VVLLVVLVVLMMMLMLVLMMLMLVLVLIMLRQWPSDLPLLPKLGSTAKLHRSQTTRLGTAARARHHSNAQSSGFAART
jgi:hypothetical protein